MLKLRRPELPSLVCAQSELRTSAIKPKLAKMMRIAALLSAVMPMAAAAQTPTKSVKFTTLFNFDGGAKGGNPAGSLIQGRDGNLYGTTFDGGSNTNKICGGSCGTVFKISPRGKLTTLYSFCAQTNCTDGAAPAAPLVLGTDGNFYGITDAGGPSNNLCGSMNCGTVFRITPGGKLTTLYNWCSKPNCADGVYGSFPEPGAFVQATDGNFYGTNDAGGNASHAGTAFKLTPSGVLETLHTFCSPTNCTDGGLPTGLIQAADGNFYGTTEQGGANGDGTVFPDYSRGQVNHAVCLLLPNALR